MNSRRAVVGATTTTTTQNASPARNLENEEKKTSVSPWIHPHQSRQGRHRRRRSGTTTLRAETPVSFVSCAKFSVCVCAVTVFLALAHRHTGRSLEQANRINLPALRALVFILSCSKYVIYSTRERLRARAHFYPKRQKRAAFWE